jgi:hypothetical protein
MGCLFCTVYGIEEAYQSLYIYIYVFELDMFENISIN